MWWARSAGLGLVNSGMDKSGTQVIPASATTQVTGFVPRAGLIGGPVGNTLVAGGPGTKNISAQVTLTANMQQNFNLVILKNGTQIANVAIPFATAVVTIPPFAHALVSGDVLTMSVISVFAGGCTIQTGSVTYLQWT